MNISSKLIQSITEELKSVINQDINYFNDKAYIIASTDKNRIGDYHEGAQIVLNTRNNLVIDSNEDYIGSRKGMNLPVYLNGEVVGEVGITGEKEQVEQYGKIIQKITQILLRDAYLNQEKIREKESRKRLLEEIIYKDTIDIETMRNWFEFLKLNIENSRNMIIINVVDLNYNEISGEYIENIYEYIGREISKNNGNISIQIGKDLIISLDLEKEDTSIIVERIEKDLKSKYLNVLPVIGVGIDTKSIVELKESYLKAKLSLKILRDYMDTGIKYYKDLDMEILLGSVGKKEVDEFIYKIFKDIDHKEIDNHAVNFLAYIDNNGSLKEASKELFIHKNTLQYRLDSLYKDTGYNPRNLKDMINLYIGFNLFRHK